MGLLASGQLECQAAQAPHVHLLAVVRGLLQAFGRWYVVPEVDATSSELLLFSQEHHRRSSHAVKFGLLANAIDVICADAPMDNVQVVQCFDPFGDTVKDIAAELFGQACIFTPDELS